MGQSFQDHKEGQAQKRPTDASTVVTEVTPRLIAYACMQVRRFVQFLPHISLNIHLVFRFVSLYHPTQAGKIWTQTSITTVSIGPLSGFSNRRRIGRVKSSRVSIGQLQLAVRLSPLTPSIRQIFGNKAGLVNSHKRNVPDDDCEDDNPVLRVRRQKRRLQEGGLA